MSKIICIRIPDENVWAEFQAFVARKHKKVKGALGKEICQALKKYLELASNTETRTHTKVGSRTMKNLRTVAERITTQFSQEISEGEVERIITETAGGEMRTLRRYKILLENYGIIQPARPIKGTFPPKHIYRVNRIEADNLR